MVKPMHSSREASKSSLMTAARSLLSAMLGIKDITPNTIHILVFGPQYPIIWVLGPLGFSRA